MRNQLQKKKKKGKTKNIANVFAKKKNNNNEADPTESGIPYFFQFPFIEMTI